MKLSNLMMLTTFEYQQGPLVAPYMYSMFHNNGGVIKLTREHVSKNMRTLPHIMIKVVWVV
jgi:hypothetical protein